MLARGEAVFQVVGGGEQKLWMNGGDLIFCMLARLSPLHHQYQTLLLGSQSRSNKTEIWLSLKVSDFMPKYWNSNDIAKIVNKYLVIDTIN